MGSAIKYYTKASYLTQITNPQGDYLEFEPEEKNPLEYLDPQTQKAEPDNFAEFFETKRLKYVKMYVKGNLFKKFTLCYKQLNVKKGEKYEKSLLQSITEKNYNGNVINTTRFVYNDVISKIGTENYNFGAIDSLILPRCGKIKYSYKKQNLSDKVSNDPIDKFDDIKVGRLESGKDYLVGMHKDDGDYFFDCCTVNPPPGSDQNGCCKQYRKHSGYIVVKIWNGVKWESKTLKTVFPDPIIWDGSYSCQTTEKYFLVTFGSQTLLNYVNIPRVPNTLHVNAYVYNEKTGNFELKDQKVFSNEKDHSCKIAAGKDFYVIYDRISFGADGYQYTNKTSVFAFDNKTKSFIDAGYFDKTGSTLDNGIHTNYLENQVTAGNDFIISGFKKG
jgi:hypothetical protein